MPSATDQPRFTRWPMIGAITWAGFLTLSALPQRRLSLIDLILLSGPLVIVPLARPLIEELWFPHEQVMYAAALCFAFAFVNPAVGFGGTALAVPWLGVAAAVTIRDAFSRRSDFETRSRRATPCRAVIDTCAWSLCIG